MLAGCRRTLRLEQRPEELARGQLSHGGGARDLRVRAGGSAGSTGWEVHARFRTGAHPRPGRQGRPRGGTE